MRTLLRIKGVLLIVTLGQQTQVKWWCRALQLIWSPFSQRRALKLTLRWLTSILRTLVQSGKELFLASRNSTETHGKRKDRRAVRLWLYSASQLISRLVGVPGLLVEAGGCWLRDSRSPLMYAEQTAHTCSMLIFFSPSSPWGDTK